MWIASKTRHKIFLLPLKYFAILAATWKYNYRTSKYRRSGKVVTQFQRCCYIVDPEPNKNQLKVKASIIDVAKKEFLQVSRKIVRLLASSFFWLDTFTYIFQQLWLHFSNIDMKNTLYNCCQLSLFFYVADEKEAVCGLEYVSSS